MVTFSGAELLESESLSGRLPHSGAFDEDYSQFVSIDREMDEGAITGENTATLATFQDVFKAFLRHTPWDSREHLNTKSGQGAPRGIQTRASSTFDGLDVYSHDAPFRPRRSVQLSCIDLLDVESSFHGPSAFGKLRLRSDLMLDSYSLEIDGESSSGSKLSHLVSSSLLFNYRHIALPPKGPLLQFIRLFFHHFSYFLPQKSRFSTTTTSTSNNIDVTSSAAQSVRISETLPTPEASATTISETLHLPEASAVTISGALPTPEWSPPSECVSPAGSWPYLPRRRRVLRKRRPIDGDTATAATSPTPCTPRRVLTKSSWSSSPGSPSSSSARRVFSSSSVSASASVVAVGEDRHGPFPRPIGGPVSPASSLSNTPPKSPRAGLRFSLLPKRKSRQRSFDSEGWVCIEVTPIIRQRYIEDLDED